MKDFIRRWAYAYSIVNIVFLIVSFVILRRLNIDVPFLRLSLGAIAISLFIASSVSVFKSNINGIMRTVLGFLLILPIVFITRKVFGVLVFRFSIAVFIFALICSIIYALAVFTVSKKYKKEEVALNELLRKRQSEISEDKIEDSKDDNLFTIN